MREVPPIAYVVAVTYIATIVYIMFVWNKDDKNKR
jgi:hypothetical protein